MRADAGGEPDDLLPIPGVVGDEFRGGFSKVASLPWVNRRAPGATRWAAAINSWSLKAMEKG